MKSVDRHKSAMLACDLAAIPPAVRKQYRELRAHLAESLDSVEETPGGYVITFCSDLLSEGDISGWIDFERRCCPWLSIRIGKILARAIEVHMSIPQGAKEVVRAEFSDWL
jgi:hypothetical protein